MSSQAIVQKTASASGSADDVEDQFDEFDERFRIIIDPETNREVELTSEIGTQIMKNYLEALKNGADSVNIVSTRMMYKDYDAAESKPEQSEQPAATTNSVPQQTREDNKMTPKQLNEQKWQTEAQSISCEQYDRDTIYDPESQKGKRLTKGCLIYVQRSNKKWQQAIIYETLKKGTNYFVNTFINCNGRVGRKKNISISDIILA